MTRTPFGLGRRPRRPAPGAAPVLEAIALTAVIFAAVLLAGLWS